MYMRVRIILLLIILSGCSSQVQEVQLHEFEPAFRNPMKGLREYFDPGQDKIRDEYPEPFGSMIKEYMQWNKMENAESDGVDKVIAYANHRWKGVEDINVKVIRKHSTKYRY